MCVFSCVFLDALGVLDPSFLGGPRKVSLGKSMVRRRRRARSGDGLLVARKKKTNELLEPRERAGGCRE